MQVNRETIGTLYDNYGHIVYRRCRRILGNDEAALDATQDVFVKALKNGQDFRADAKPLTWLYRISTNLCLNRLRDQKGRLQKLHTVHKSKAQGVGALRPLPSRGIPTASASELQATIRSLLEQADEHQRAIVVYYYYDGMTLQEIANMLHLSVPTVRKRLQAFKDFARQALEDAPPFSAAQMALLLFIETLLNAPT